jgi:hypothetical protein
VTNVEYTVEGRLGKLAGTCGLEELAVIVDKSVLPVKDKKERYQTQLNPEYELISVESLNV